MTRPAHVPDSEEAFLGRLADNEVERLLFVGRQDAAREPGQAAAPNELADAGRPKEVGPEAEDATHVIRESSSLSSAAGWSWAASWLVRLETMAVRGAEAAAGSSSRRRGAQGVLPLPSTVSPSRAWPLTFFSPGLDGHIGHDGPGRSVLAPSGLTLLTS